jgi:hypothetical protein
VTGTAPTRFWSAELAWAAIAMAACTALYLLAARRGVPGPGDLVGHGLGIVGFLLMVVAETAYSWRKRPARTGPGPTVRWLQLHVVAGLVGPYLVLLHSAFRFRGLAGVLSLLTLVIVVSGVAGRYWYAAAAPDTAERQRRALWYVLHVPLSAALFALALFHVAGVLWYAVNLR